ncbi:MAG: class I SAM-dependent methyltransferase, partial [Gammaproteobacteria bacterium]
MAQGPRLGCTACGSPQVEPLLDIEDVPIHCNVPRRSYEEAKKVQKGTIRLGFCQACGHLYNTDFDAQRIEYAPGYENSLDFSPRFQVYARALALRLVEQYELRGKDITEIACGNGQFLRLLCDIGDNRGVGFDPSRVIDSGGDHPKITFIQDFYSERHRHCRADFICCRQALEHIQYPQQFLRMIRRVIEGSSHVFFEVPNSLYTLRDLGIWDLIYEHCSYFWAGSLGHAFEESGFSVVDIREEFDGQFLSIVACPKGESRSMEQWEEAGDIAPYVRSFRASYLEKRHNWRCWLKAAYETGKKVVLWGGGSKGVT